MYATVTDTVTGATATSGRVTVVFDDISGGGGGGGEGGVGGEGGFGF